MGSVVQVMVIFPASVERIAGLEALAGGSLTT